jgi:hypothetical protein
MSNTKTRKAETPEQIHAAVRSKVHREIWLESRLTPARLAENFRLGGVAGVELREGAHPTAKVFRVYGRSGAKWKISILDREMWVKQVQYILNK